MSPFSLVINDNELCCETFGREDAPLMIALHGAPGVGWRDEPRETFKEYSDMFRVLVFDLRGSGHSGGTPPFSHASWVADVESLRQWARVDRFVLAGGSYGGFLALEYAVKHPNRVRALVLRDTAASSKGLNEAAIERAKASDRIKVDVPRLMRLFNGQMRDNEDLKETFKAILPLYTHDYDPGQAEEALKSCIFRFETHNAAFANEVPRFNVTDRLNTITCPTLVTVGRADWACTVERNEVIAAGVPNSTFVIFERSGHAPQVEEKELWHKTVRDFLCGLST